MSTSLRLGLLIAALLVFALIVMCIFKKLLNIKYSIVWLVWSLLSLLMAIFPETFYRLAHILGIEMAVNAVFLIMIFLLYALVFYLFIMISKHNEEIVQLTYEISSLKKEIEELKIKK